LTVHRDKVNKIDKWMVLLFSQNLWYYIQQGIVQWSKMSPTDGSLMWAYRAAT